MIRATNKPAVPGGKQLRQPRVLAAEAQARLRRGARARQEAHVPLDGLTKDMDKPAEVSADSQAGAVEEKAEKTSTSKAALLASQLSACCRHSPRHCGLATQSEQDFWVPLA